ncbi:hypothetical protein DEO72_LG8g1684 [Vigna unguiculata]|uniref:Uncharacterized protein n=1 Tax=Vigna unguiculata TaxID=3917 RepID=A0A4D6MU67_VIGUN|nr:hypothetical protein DEO72_LG8g1684 [Vigna unguiculata]
MLPYDKDRIRKSPQTFTPKNKSEIEKQRVGVPDRSGRCRGGRRAGFLGARGPSVGGWRGGSECVPPSIVDVVPGEQDRAAMRGIRVCVALSTVKTVAAAIPRVTETLRCVVLLFVNQFFHGHARKK